jgi:hypothetical protein
VAATKMAEHEEFPDQVAATIKNFLLQLDQLLEVRNR